MIQEQRLLWHGESKNSFWEERKFLYAEIVDFKAAKKAWNERKKPKEKKEKPAEDIAIFKSFDTPTPFESIEGREREQTLSQGVDNQMNGLEDWFTRFNILSYDSGYQENFKALQAFLQEDENATKDTEILARKSENNEIRQLYQFLKLGKPSSYTATNDNDKSVMGTGLEELRNISLSDPSIDGRKQFRNHLKSQFDQERLYLQNNVSNGCNKYIQDVNKDMSGIVKDYPEISEMNTWKEMEGDLSNLHNLKNEIVNAVKDLDFNSASNSEAATKMQEVFNKELSDFAKRNGKEIKDLTELDRKECWSKASKEYWKEKRSDLKFLTENFIHEVQTIRWQLYNLREFLEKKSKVTAAEIHKKILPQTLLETHLPAGYPDTTFDALINQQLEGEPNKVKRALKAARFLKGAEEWMNDQTQGGLLKGFDSAEQMEDVLHQASFDEERKKNKIGHFTGEVNKITGELTEATSALKQIKDVFINDINGASNTTLSSDNRQRVISQVHEYENELQNFQEEIHVISQNKNIDQGILLEIYDRAIDARANIDRYRAYLDSVVAKTVDKHFSGIEIRFVSPNSFTKTIKNILKVFTEEIDHDHDLAAAMLQQNIGTGLKDVLPGWPGHIMDLAGKRGRLKKESLDASERKEFDYSGVEHQDLLKAFYSWNDGNEQHLRALLEAMQERGFIRWDDERLWSHLAKATGIEMPAVAKQNTALRNVYLGKMLGKLFQNKNWFGGAQRNNLKGFVNKYTEKKEDAKKIDNEKGIRKRFTNILKAHYENNKDYLDNNGQIATSKPRAFLFDKDSAVDPHLYAAMLIHETEAMGMSGEEVVFYLIRGVASGLLAHEFLVHFADKNFYNSWMDLNVFRKMSMAQVREFDRHLTRVQFPGGIQDFKDENLDPYLREKYFFRGDMEKVMKVIQDGFATDDGVADRTNRIIEKWKDVDKDIHQNALNRVPPSQLVPLLGKYSGTAVLDKSKTQNGITGFATRLDAFNIEPDRWNKGIGPKKQIAKLASSLSSGMLLFGAMDGRAEFKDASTLSPSDWNETPAGGFDAGLTTIQYANVVQNFIATFLCAIPEANIGKFSKEEVLSMVFAKDRPTQQKVQDEIIRTLSLKGELEKLIVKHSDYFLYLMETWQDNKAFCNYYNAKNSLEMGTAGNDYTLINPQLKFQKAKFKMWQQSKCPPEFRKAQTTFEEEIEFSEAA